jgi:hypothetical protein
MPADPRSGAVWFINVEHPMRTSAHLRFVRFAAPAAILALAACGDSGGGVTTPTPAPTPTGPSSSCASTLSLSLTVGEVRPLTSEQAACFTIQTSGSSRYVLAGFDTRAVDGARVGAEPSLSAAPNYVLGSGAPLASSAVSASMSGAVATDVVMRQSASSAVASPYTRETPWKVGETFAIQPLEGSAPVTARIVRIQGGHIAVAIVDEQATSHASRFTSDVEKALDYMSTQGFAVLNAAYGAQRPITSAGSGQLLVVLSAWNPDHGAGASLSEPLANGAGPGTVLWMNLDIRPGVRDGQDAYDVMAYRLKVLSHELSHAWQARYMWQSRPAGETRSAGAPAWAGEGGADFVSLDIVRRYLGVGLQSNWDWATALKNLGNPLVLALEPASRRGKLANGYFDASSFMRDLQVRLVRRGMSADAALAEIAQGSMEGWFGVDGAGVRRRGLSDRMSSAMGSAWDPSDAALLWALAQAADEETSNPDLNNQTFRSAADGDSRFAWAPAASEITAGATGAQSVSAPAGGVFYVRVRSEGGGVVAARSDLPARWMIARVR